VSGSYSVLLPNGRQDVTYKVSPQPSNHAKELDHEGREATERVNHNYTPKPVHIPVARLPSSDYKTTSSPNYNGAIEARYVISTDSSYREISSSHNEDSHSPSYKDSTPLGHKYKSSQSHQHSYKVLSSPPNKENKDTVLTGYKEPHPSSYKEAAPTGYKEPHPSSRKEPLPSSHKDPAPTGYKESRLSSYEDPHSLSYQNPGPTSYKEPRPPSKNSHSIFLSIFLSIQLVSIYHFIYLPFYLSNLPV